MSLLHRDPDAPKAWRDEMPVESRYSAGVANERFLRGLMEDGKIHGATCSRCELTYVPGRLFCERCLDELEEWVDVGTQATVHTFTLVYATLDGERSEEPEVIAFLRIADGGLVHRLGEVEVEQLEIGMPVEAAFKPRSEREGSILDIKYFRPLDAA